MPQPNVIYGDNQWLAIIADGLTSTDKTTWKTGSKNSIGSTALQMYSSNYPLRIGVTVKASSVNAGRIYVGTSSDVTQNTNANTDGFELSAGESHFFLVNNLNTIWIIASQSGQKAFFTGV